jgi:hypothetical protein
MSGGRRPSVIFHIGQHKTGSQAFLAHNRHVLRAQGVLYPAEERPQHGVLAYARSQYRLFVLVRRDALAATAGSTAAAAYWEQQSSFCQPLASLRAFFEALEAERCRSGWTRAVLSAEDLFDMQTAHATEFAPELVEAGARLLAKWAETFGYDARVVVYLRRQDHLLGAHYVQYIKGSPIHDVSLDSFARKFAPRLDARRILACWEPVFRGRILVRPYEGAALPGGIVPDFFEHALAQSVPAECTAPPADAESINRGLGRDFIEFVRILNARHAAGQLVFERDDVLDAALRTGPALGGPAGIAAWLSPAQRRELLAVYAAGNAAIGRNLCGRTDGQLFAEPPPVDDGNYPYTGLSADKATAIALAIHEAALARRTTKDLVPRLGVRPGERWRVMRRLFRAVRRLRARWRQHDVMSVAAPRAEGGGT